MKNDWSWKPNGKFEKGNTDFTDWRRHDGLTAEQRQHLRNI